VSELSAEEVLTTTRAVRHRLDIDRPVPLEVITECLRIAVQAPTGGNQQDWRWIVLTDAGIRHSIAEIYRSAALANFERARDAAEDDMIRRIYAGAAIQARMLEEIPVLVVACKLGRLQSDRNSEAAGFYGSIIPAVWSFQLALRSRGLGSVYTTAHLSKEADVAAALGIPADVSQVALIPVAYTKGVDFRPAGRRPIEEVAFLNHWGAPIA
jgi:nitroreductase